ncbi:MAG: hypothetical protein B7Z08_02480 [Sphingomonadales bacterium 32-68-7]|nr:MAG: hypothetical protein B7Z33_02900 [Sphingomonadales bacterium 12-68-11]OYX10106.1 MAG: hypothetical protein B7Z08_02480 [Sphingomonadales bacterium 32-68-7]
MNRLERQLAEDLALRDAALGLFKSDLALLRADLRERGLGTRLADRIGDGTMDMVDDAVDYAEAHRGKIAALGIALVLWLARGPILRAISSLFDDPDAEPDDADDRSDDD